MRYDTRAECVHEEIVKMLGKKVDQFSVTGIAEAVVAEVGGKWEIAVDQPTFWHHVWRNELVSRDAFGVPWDYSEPAETIDDHMYDDDNADWDD